jgi:hypothetical protein
MIVGDIKKVWIDDASVYVETRDGRTAHEDFANYRRLRDATEKQRKNFALEGFGIRWPDIDEDLCFDGFFNKKGSEVADLVRKHPIINASALARRMGIPQPLFAAYVTGAKKPSTERISKIRAEIRKVGRELADV